MKLQTTGHARYHSLIIWIHSCTVSTKVRMSCLRSFGDCATWSTDYWCASTRDSEKAYSSKASYLLKLKQSASSRMVSLKPRPKVLLLISKRWLHPFGNPDRQNPKPATKKLPKCESEMVERCFPCSYFYLRSMYRYRNDLCHSCGRTGYIWKVCSRFMCHITRANKEVLKENTRHMTTMNLSTDSQQLP